MAHRDKCINRIRIDFSTLFTLDADRPSRAAGVHCFNALITKGTRFGRCLTRVAQLLSNADTRSTSLYECLWVGDNKEDPTHWLVYKVVTIPSNSFCPSFSSLAVDMNGWSAGQKERLGSFLF